MYTAEQARSNEEYTESLLDSRIRREVAEAQAYGATTASIRVNRDDPFFDNIEEELKKRGFTNICVPEIIISGDVDFSW